MTVMQQGDWRVASESEGESGSGGVERAGSYICMYVCMYLYGVQYSTVHTGKSKDTGAYTYNVSMFLNGCVSF